MALSDNDHVHVPPVPERRMQLVPLSTDGRVTVVVTAPLPPGPLRVALRVDAQDVVIETLGPAGARPIARFAAADAGAYRPVLARLAARGQVGTCPARMVHTGDARTLILHLGSPARCAPREGHGPSATARTSRLRAAVPTACAARPQRSATSTLSRPRVAGPAAPARPASPPMSPPTSPPASLPARPPARFGQPDDPAPRMTGPQRWRVLWATVAVAAALLLACVLQPDSSTDTATGAPACTGHGATCTP